MMDVEDIAREIVDSAVKIHRALGPGLLESAYQRCLAYELQKRGLQVETEIYLPVIYDGQQIDASYRLDMLVEDVVIIENKAVEKLLPIHKAQILTYLKLRQLWLGFLINWNVRLIKHGINRVVNGKRGTTKTRRTQR